MTLANQLTIWRMALALAMFLALMQKSPHFHLWAFILFLAAMLTDWIDGAVARMTHTISAFGKVADPIADKILVIGALIALLRNRELPIPLWGVFLIIARELLIGGIRILASAQGKLPDAAATGTGRPMGKSVGVHVPGAERWGKWKMAVQSLSVFAMLGLLVLQERQSDLPSWLLRMPYYLTVLCVIVAWSSAYLYFRQSRKMLEKSWG